MAHPVSPSAMHGIGSLPISIAADDNPSATKFAALAISA